MAATRTHAGSTAQTGNATTYTFSTHSISTAAADRYVAVAFTSFNNSGAARTLDSASIAGVSATIHRTDPNSVSLFSGTWSGIFGAAVPTGTTGDIILTFNAGMQQCTVSVYALYGAKHTPFHTNGNSGSGLSAISTTLNIAEGGIGIASAHCANNAVAHTATGLTEDTDATVESTQRYHVMSAQSLSVETGRTITSTGTANTFRSITAGSWEPATYALPPFRRRTRFFTQRFYRPEPKKLELPKPRSLILPNSYKRAA